MNTAPTLRARQRGITLVECCTVLGVAAVLLGTAVPSFEQLRERRHVEAAAAQLETDVHDTRSLAVARNQIVRVSFAGPACYLIHTGPSTECACGADGSASCGPNAEVLRRVVVAGARLQSNRFSMAFEPVKGTVTPTASVRVLGSGGSELRKVVNLMGRVRTCAPAPGLPGHPDC